MIVIERREVRITKPLPNHLLNIYLRKDIHGKSNDNISYSIHTHSNRILYKAPNYGNPAKHREPHTYSFPVREQ